MSESEGAKEGSGESSAPAAPVFGAAFTFGAPGGAGGFGAAAGGTTFAFGGAKATGVCC